MPAKVTTIGDRVKLKKNNLVGIVRFIGEIQGKKGIFYGVELDDEKGKNDGSVAKIPYFKCTQRKGLFVKKTGIAKTNRKYNKNAPRVTVGDHVKVTKANCIGIIRFIGTPYSVRKEGIFYGIELIKPKGKNNGIVKYRWYFTCKDKYGIFVQAAGFSVLPSDLSSKGGIKKKKKKENEVKDDKKEEEEEEKKEEEEEKKEDIEYKVGDRIMIKPNRKGQIKWIGEEKAFGTGNYYGIRLTENRGDNDGKWKDVRKFQCPERFGVYIPLRLIVKPIDDDFDFMNEEEKYAEEARIKAEEFKKERDELHRLSQRISKHKILAMRNNELIKYERYKSEEKQNDDSDNKTISNMNWRDFTDSDYKETAVYLKRQCFNAISDFGESLVMIATIGRNNDINIVPLLFDIYSFYKYKTAQNENITHNMFCERSSILNKLRERDEEHSKIYRNIVSMLSTFNHRHNLNPPFNPNSFVKIDDNINEYIQYTLNVSTMLNNIITNNSSCLPLLIDLWMIPKKIKTVLNVEYDEYDESDDGEASDYDESEEEEDEYEEEGYIKLSSSFEENLKKYGAIYEIDTIECKSEIQCIEKLENVFKKILNKYRMSIKICIIIDKRKEKNNLLIYQLPLKYSAIPRNYCIETLIYSSSQHIMYDIDNSVLKQTRTVNNAYNYNTKDAIFGAKYDCDGQMFCLSFALQETNKNRIQFWMNGGGIRFWPQYMINIWPKLFVNPNIDKKYIENDYIKNNFNLNVKDPLFHAWYRHIVDF